MNKYIWRTSLVWVGVLAAIAGAYLYRTHMPSKAVTQTHGIEPVAMGPEVNPAGTANGTANAAVPEQAVDSQLVPIQLTPEKMQSIGVKIGTVEYQTLSDDIRATGTVEIDERLVSYVQIRFPGYVRQVYANATYLFVRKGQPLFTVYSPDLVQTQKEYLLAEQNHKLMEASTVDGVASGASLLTTAAEDRLRQWDIPEAAITKLKSTGKPETEITINSPVSGYVTERNALPNLYADPSTRLYTIADLSRVWIDAQVFQDDVGRVKPGDRADVAVDAYPGQVLRGTVESILPQVDMTTRTVKVRLEVANPGLKLKPGMFVNVAMKANLGRQLVVPASAIFESGLRRVAFLDRGNGNLEPREVEVGARVGDNFVVTKGLEVHQRIVTSANFLVDSESQLQAAAGAPAAAPITATVANDAPVAADLKVEMAMKPNPPHKGSNQATVTVAKADGTPLSGAQVSVTFYMPAMPAMGMAAVTTKADLAPKGAGSYAGTISLESGGTWQVTINVTQNGQVVATKRMAVNAEGGM
jgi:RND family efflux transporter MFP subunit